MGPLYYVIILKKSLIQYAVKFLCTLIGHANCSFMFPNLIIGARMFFIQEKWRNKRMGAFKRWYIKWGSLHYATILKKRTNISCIFSTVCCLTLKYAFNTSCIGVCILKHLCDVSFSISLCFIYVLVSIHLKNMLLLICVSKNTCFFIIYIVSMPFCTSAMFKVNKWTWINLMQ